MAHVYTLYYKQYSVQSQSELKDFKLNVQTKSSFTLFLMPIHSTSQTAQLRVK